MLAARVLMEQAVQVIGICFTTPFFGSLRAQQAAESLGIELRVVDISEDHLRMVQNPPHGYGRNMNPCIDCHAMMFNRAGKIMEKEGADFLFSGEVLDERPMSQNYGSLKTVAEESGYEEHIIRPLSAGLLPISLPEEEGKVDRGRLLDIRGRSRKRQMALAEKFGIKKYPSPAGGCLLTDPLFSKRLKDLFDHSALVTVRDAQLLKLGRHIRIDEKTKVILGRREQENAEIARQAAPGDAVLEVAGYPGPVALVRGKVTQEAIEMAAALCVRYSDAPGDEEVAVKVDFDKKTSEVSATSAEDWEIRKLLI